MSEALSSAREAAYAALMACETQGAWSDQAIRSASKKWKLTPRDAALAARLISGLTHFPASPWESWTFRCGRACGWACTSSSF